MTTREAFANMVSERNWHQKIEGLNPNLARVLKHSFKAGTIQQETMERNLLAAGYEVKQEKLWEK